MPDERDQLRGAYRGRLSRQRVLIAAAADDMASAFSARELLAAVSAADARTGLATVYRAIKELCGSGFIERVGSRDGAAVYARCRSAGHHHHLVCTECGRVEDSDCGVEEALRQVAAATGFAITGHELNMSGVCPACAERSGGER
jgi:Fur family ferric uptake transcriptional regulator